MDWDSTRREIDDLINKFQKIGDLKREQYFEMRIRPYFEERIKKIRPGLRGEPENIQEKFWGDDGIVRRIFLKKEDARHGSLGELEFLERKIRIEKVPVEVLPEKQNEKLEGNKSHKKNPDFKLILKEKGKELITEVKSPTANNIERTKKLVENANGQIKGSPLETKHSLPDELKKYPDRAQGSLEIQYNDKYVSTLDKAGLKKTEEEIRKAFSPGKNRSVIQVRVYRDHQLVLELKRNRENQIIKTYPVREQEKGRKGMGGERNQRSQLNVLKEVVSQAKDNLQRGAKDLASREGNGAVNNT